MTTHAGSVTAASDWDGPAELIKPLEYSAHWTPDAEVPETFPFGV